MKTSFFIIWLSIAISGDLNAQLKIIDYETNREIAFVEVFSSNGDLIGLSSADGVINLTVLNNIKTTKADSFTLNHIGYEEIKYEKSDLLATSLIKMKLKHWDLDEVVIKAKRNQYYLKLTGFYRSFQINNNELKYFVEGKIDILYPPNTKKAPKNKRLQERYFTNLKYLNSQKNGTIVTIKAIGPPIPQANIAVVDIEKDFKT